MTKPSTRPNLRKLALQLLVGAVCGYAAMAGASKLVLRLDFSPGPGEAALLGVGLIYALMGLVVGAGVAVPALGGAILNVADRDDLADQRALLAGSAGGCLALALGLIALALAGPGGLLPASAGIVALGLGTAAMLAITTAQWRLYDELMRRISMEASALTLGLAILAMSLWAGLFRAGQVGPLDPLVLLALGWGGLLLGTMIAVARRGLLLPR